MSLAELMAEILAPESKATRNERDAAATVMRDYACRRCVLGKAYHAEVLELKSYYHRVHLGVMGTHLTARGA